MAAEGRVEGAAVERDGLERPLRENPTAVEFFQAIRLLERAHPDRAPVGGFGEPAGEVVHFAVPPSTAFPASEIQTLEELTAETRRMLVNFMGLTGPLGVLPLAYTLKVAERERAGDHRGEHAQLVGHAVEPGAWFRSSTGPGRSTALPWPMSGTGRTGSRFTCST
jgi:type VI secretion system protein ImpH